MQLDDTMALAWGRSRLGRSAEARAFARGGARPFFAGRTTPPLKDMAGQIPANGGSVEIGQADLLDPAAARAVPDDVARREGRIDAWFDPPFERRRARHHAERPQCRRACTARREGLSVALCDDPARGWATCRRRAAGSSSPTQAHRQPRLRRARGGQAPSAARTHPGSPATRSRWRRAGPRSGTGCRARSAAFARHVTRRSR
jgi:hypothetical protein